MKVALILRRIGPYHHARFKAAAKLMDLHVLETRPSSQEYPWEFHHEEREYQTYALGNPPDPEQGFKGQVLRIRINKILSKINPDVIVTVGWADQEYHETLLWAIKKKVSCSVVSDSGIDDVKRYAVLEKMKKIIVSTFSSALVAGRRSRTYLEKLGMHPDHIFTAWDVVDNDYFYKTTEQIRLIGRRNYNLPSRYFLCVSRFIPKKNIVGLIEAFHNFITQSATDYALIIVGSGEMESEIKEKIVTHRLSDKVLLPGFLQVEQLPVYYAFAEALILPSYSDQWGLVVNEAMASGLPVLVSKQCGCTDDIVLDGENGFLFDPFDNNSITQSLLKFDALNDGQRLAWSRKSLQIIGNYNLNAFAKGLKNTVEKALKHPVNRSLLSRTVLQATVFLRKS